ncbi:MAG: GNAT family N-acetyltransferase [Alphaproteobacteria bacterium]
MNEAVEIAACCEPELLAGLHQASADEPWDAGAMARLLALAQTIGLVAARGETPCGLVLARITGEDCEILSIGVTKAMRRRGIGAALLDAAGDWAARLGARRLVLEVAGDNLPALRLYDGAGFEPCGRRPGYYPGSGEGAPRRDALILHKALAAPGRRGGIGDRRA